MPDYHPSRAVQIANAAERNGISGLWFADEIYHRDSWIVMGLVAAQTSRIRIGTGVTHTVFREPAFMAQSFATLDEIAPGRVFCGLSIGNLSMLDGFHIDWKGGRLFRQMEEAVAVMRTLWVDGRLDFKGKFREYTGITTSARPAHKIPIYIGGMNGPTSFRYAGRLGDGVTSALGNSKEYHQYVLSNVAEAARKAGRDPEKMEYAVWDPFVVSHDSEAAKKAVAALVGTYVPGMGERQLKFHGIEMEEVMPINEAFARGDIKKAVELTPPEIAEKLSIAGSPEECIQKLRSFKEWGIDEVYLGLGEPEMIKALTGTSVIGIPDYFKALEIIGSEILPNI